MAKQNEEFVDVKIYLFDVEGEKDMRIEYPELMKIDEFSGLTKKEVRLCWLIGNRTSPINSLSRDEKIKRAMDIVFNNGLFPKNLKEMYDNGSLSIPQNILLGIQRMSWFDPENRLRAKLMTQYMFDMLNEMVVIDKATLASMDADDKKKFAELIIKVNGELPNMIKTLEEGYGVKVVEKKTEKKVLVSINTIQPK